MLPHSTLLFIGGVGTLELFILLPVLAIPSFFAFRALLKFLAKKGATEINIASAIMALLITPVLAVIVAGLITWYFTYTDTSLSEEQMSEWSTLDSLNRVAMDTTEIDVVAVSPDKAKVLLDNEYVRVLEYTLAPGERDNPHTHPPKSYYVVQGGVLRVFPEGGEPFDAEEKQGTAEWGDHVGMHYVENVGTSTVKLLVTEVKGAWY